MEVDFVCETGPSRDIAWEQAIDQKSLDLDRVVTKRVEVWRREVNTGLRAGSLEGLQASRGEMRPRDVEDVIACSKREHVLGISETAEASERAAATANAGGFSRKRSVGAAGKGRWTESFAGGSSS